MLDEFLDHTGIDILTLIADIKIVVIPQQPGGGLLFGAALRLQGKDELDCRRCRPGFLVEFAVHSDATRNASLHSARDRRLRDQWRKQKERDEKSHRYQSTTEPSSGS